MNRCVGDTTLNHIIDKPVIPTIWPRKTSTNLTKDEIISLEEVGFVINK
jgi:hypothetical protein